MTILLQKKKMNYLLLGGSTMINKSEEHLHIKCQLQRNLKRFNASPEVTGMKLALIILSFTAWLFSFYFDASFTDRIFCDIHLAGNFPALLVD